jgi:hypothetical protein
LCIGVDTSEGQEALAEADARALAQVANQQGFHSSTLLLGAAATRARVCSGLRDAAGECRPGDLFMLTFSGHGGRRHCGGGASGEGLRGAWVLFDGSFDDEEMHGALAAFQPGVRVLVISDSCNGGVPAAEEGSSPLSKVSASVLVLSACGPDQYADAAGMPAHFTTALLRTWHRGRGIASYRGFHERIAADMPAYQRPDFYKVGPSDPHFEDQAPFTV